MSVNSPLFHPDPDAYDHRMVTEAAERAKTVEEARRLATRRYRRQQTVDGFVHWLLDFPGALILTFVAALGFFFWLVWGMVHEARSPVITIKKSEWSCTQTGVENTVATVPVFANGGTSLAVVPSTQAICVRYERKQ